MVSLSIKDTVRVLRSKKIFFRCPSPCMIVPLFVFFSIGDFEFSDKNNDEFEELMKKEIDSTTGIFNTVITFDNEQINLDDI